MKTSYKVMHYWYNADASSRSDADTYDIVVVFDNEASAKNYAEELQHKLEEDRRNGTTGWADYKGTDRYYYEELKVYESIDEFTTLNLGE